MGFHNTIFTIDFKHREFIVGWIFKIPHIVKDKIPKNGIICHLFLIPVFGYICHPRIR